MNIKEKYFVTSEVSKNRPGTWDSKIVTIHQRDETGATKIIGTYKRNYHDDPSNTFCPFVSVSGKELALYSNDYVCTRLMELPSCKDIGGEPNDANGFCPVEYYVPEKGEKQHVAGSGLDGSFGFVSGCVWGDDSSMKVEHLDLREADNGIVKRTDKYGYVELPRNVSLKDAVSLDWASGEYKGRKYSEKYTEIATKLSFDEEEDISPDRLAMRKDIEMIRAIANDMVGLVSNNPIAFVDSDIVKIEKLCFELKEKRSKMITWKCARCKFEVDKKEYLNEDDLCGMCQKSQKEA